jgi:hypothetical protein
MALKQWHPNRAFKGRNLPAHRRLTYPQAFRRRREAPGLRRVVEGFEFSPIHGPSHFFSYAQDAKNELICAQYRIPLGMPQAVGRRAVGDTGYVRFL